MWGIIRKKLLLIAVVTVLCTMLSGIITFFFIEPEYRSTVAVFINDMRSDAATGQTISEINMYEKLVATYSEIAKSRTTAEHVIEALDLDVSVGALQQMITTSPRGNTQFLNLSVTCTDREMSYRVANQLALSLKVVARQVRGEDLVQIMDPANVPTAPSSPNLQLNLAIGFVLGVMVSVFGVFLLEFLDKTIKEEGFITGEAGLPILGTIPHIR